MKEKIGIAWLLWQRRMAQQECVLAGPVCSCMACRGPTRTWMTAHAQPPPASWRSCSRPPSVRVAASSPHQPCSLLDQFLVTALAAAHAPAVWGCPATPLASAPTNLRRSRQLQPPDLCILQVLAGCSQVQEDCCTARLALNPSVHVCPAQACAACCTRRV